MTLSPARTLPLLALTCLLAAACGPTRRGSVTLHGGGDDPIDDPADPPDPPDPPGNDYTSVILVPRAVSTIVSAPSRAAWILLPSGAVREPVELTLQRLSFEDVNAIDNEGVIEAVYRFTPSSQRFLVPATLRLPLDGAHTDGMTIDLVVLRRGLWRTVRGADPERVGDAVTATITRLGTYAIRLTPIDDAASSLANLGDPV